jgi:L-alanine-DL-glutamate epimerase-like enolase superfamily enzyme
MATRGSPIAIESVKVDVFVVPTDAPESDGTFEWSQTTLVLVTIRAGGQVGLGYTYASRATGTMIRETLAPLIRGRDALAVTDAWHAMIAAVRNMGRPGVASMAISAMDVALWDLKARLLDLPLATLLGMVRSSVPVYGSGGFTSYDDRQLTAQLAGWAEAGIRDVKMKVGRDPTCDPERVRLARQAIGPHVGLFVDANGAYSAKQALRLANDFATNGVVWFEEPVSSDDLAGLRLMVERAPPGMDIAAGEYGYDPVYFRRMLAAGAVDVLQADATRCGGVTGFLLAAALAEAWSMPLSAHTAPLVHTQVGCACKPVRNLEYFHDHARIELMLLDGARAPQDGTLSPNLQAPGMGVTFKAADADRFAA